MKFTEQIGILETAVHQLLEKGLDCQENRSSKRRIPDDMALRDEMYIM